MIDLGQAVAGLSPEQRELLLLRLRRMQKTDGHPPVPPLVPVPRDGSGLPLSYGQQRLWFLDRLEPGNPAYHLVNFFRLEGQLDMPALIRTLHGLVRRHEVLRTVFRLIDGEPRQLALPAFDVPFPLVDLSTLPPALQEGEVRHWAAAEARRPFDLERGRPLRAHMLHLGEEANLLLLVVHHIASDGWSVGILARETVQLYTAFRRGDPSPLPELPIQYADFAVWQRAWLQGKDLDRQLAYWRTHLAGVPESLDLPIDRPRPAVQSSRGARRTFRWPPALAEDLQRLGRAHGATLFTVVLAAFQALLHRYTHAADFSIGCPVANRNRTETENLIGFFVNTLVLRADLSGAPSFQELLGRARETVLQAQAHQDLPFEKLVEELSPERDLSRSPLFQVMFVLQNATRTAFQLPEVRLVNMAAETAAAHFDLTLEAADDGSGLGALEFNTDLFEAVTAQRLVSHLEALLAAVVDRPDSKLSGLALLGAAERHQILLEWNATRQELAGEASLTDLFAAQAERQPDATAVVAGRHHLSYGGVAARARGIGGLLGRLGVGPGELVAVLLDRSAEMVPALLGILESGAAYLPLDLRFPSARIGWILEAMKVPAIVTETPHLALLAHLLPELPRLRHLICLDREDGSEAPALPARRQLWNAATLPFSGGASPGRGTADALAYVIFTSGSTGTPKGVMVRHRPVVNLIDWVHHSFAMGPVDRVLFVTALTFDLSVYDVFGLLAAGGSIRVASEEEVADPQTLARVLTDEPITFWDSAPAALQQLVPFLPEAERCQAAALRLVFLSGDWVPLSLPDQVRQSFPGARVVALGGATEATVWSNSFTVAEVSPRWRSIPYGRPIQNARYYVLDAHLSPCPLGVAGDLYIGGGCLSSGYAEEAVLTASKYLPDPCGEGWGAVMYRTGDRARFLADGNIEFLGRLDHQVKIRGFRIELGEVESVLSHHPGVNEALVLLREDRPGDRQLVAYAIPAPGASSQAEELRAFVRERLPEYMMPAAFVFLQAFPITANGKVDRKALPAPERTFTRRGEKPRGPVEELLAGIFAEVLQVEQVSRDDHFFELGGHSLLATQVVSRVQSTLDVDLPLRSVFEHPTVALLGQDIAAQRHSGARLPPIPQVDRSRPPALSFAQERLWFLDQLEPGSARYNVPAAVRLAGRLEPAAIAASVDEIVHRHEVLRTTFDIADGQPVQAIAPPSRQVLPLLDLSGLPAALREVELRRRVAEDGARPFDLAAGPLLRVALVRLAPEDHGVLVNMHHVVSDAWSMGILLQELTALYSAFTTGSPSPLPALSIQYADFAAWQRSWLESGVLEAQLAWWREQLAGAPAVLELPTDRPRPVVPSARGGSVEVRLPAELAAGLKALARGEGATLFMTLLGLFQVLLGRHTGIRDLVVGSPIAGRTRAEVEPLIGFFVNTLALRADLSGDPSLREILARVRSRTLGAYSHQDVPFEKLVEELAPERDLGHTPLFQVAFALQNAPAAAAGAADFEMRNVAMPAGAAKFDLTLTLTETAGEIAGALDYSADLFDGATVVRLGEHWRTLLAGAVAGPQRSIGELPLLSTPEQHQVLLEWNDTARSCPQVPMVHELVSAHARRRPGATAMRAADGRLLTYGELEARSNRLAHHLRRLGVGPEVPVAICADRTLERAVAILGAVKAGGVYVSLDPTYPRERLAYQLEDAGAAVVLTQERYTAALPQTGGQVLRLDADWEAIEGDESVPPESGLAPENLAYVVYTSGSTGTPKGVQIPHAGLMNLVRWHQNLYGVHPEDRGTQIASPAFDASIWELWPYLAGGAGLHIPDEETRLSSAGMIRWWAEQGITLAYLMTPLAEGVLEEKIPPRLDLRVRALIIGGDRLHRGPDPEAGFRLMNHYGPAEYTVTSTVIEVPPQAPGGQGGALPTIGRAIDNTQIYILDTEGLPVPMGVTGELYVAGVGLARGYHGRPELTAEKFVPDPFAVAPGARMYRTADLVRWLPDGDIDFLGRLDHQVKIRGLRIELGEIETVLGHHPAVREAAVLVREDRPGVKRLVAYVAPFSRPEPAPEELREHLRQRLPEYMVPAAFVFVESLPLTSNGKVDRRALERLTVDAEVRQAATTAPRTPTEELLAGIWAEVLKLERVGMEESFFELGGHSLLATQMISRIRQTFGIDLPLRHVFGHPTIGELAEVVDGAVRGGQDDRMPPLAPLAPGDGPPLSFAQQRLWLVDQLEPESPAYNIPMAFEIRGRLDIPAMERTLSELVRRHVVLRTTFQNVDGQPVQTAVPAAPWVLPVMDLSSLEEGPQRTVQQRLVQEEARRPFDLTRGPMLRTLLLRLEEDRYIATFTLHHIAGDGWSMGVLAREISRLYQAFVAGKPSQLPELAVQYGDFAAWQRHWLTAGAEADLLRYWQRQLGRDLPVLGLPASRPRPAVRSQRGGNIPFQLSADLSTSLRHLCRREGVTLFMALLAGLNALLHRLTGQEDLVVGTEVAGRDRLELEPLIGFFVNIVLLRTRLTGRTVFRDLLVQVREGTLGAYTHQGLPFDRLIEELQPERQGGQAWLPQVVLVWQTAPAEKMSLPDLSFHPLPVEGGTSKFELLLLLSEEGEQIAGRWIYSSDLFTETEVRRMADQLAALMDQVTVDPDLRLGLIPLSQTQGANREMSIQEQKDPKEARLTRLLAAKPKAVTMSQHDLVKMTPLLPGSDLPLLIEPVAEQIDIVTWTAGNRSLVEEKLLLHGALLFRGFGIRTVEQFEKLATVLTPELFDEYGDLPREGMGGKVYSSTPYPADKAILMHNESSQMHCWPLKQWFYCLIPAEQGGETPVADCREVYRRLRPALRDRFREKGLLYVRNFTEGLDVSWQDFFRTSEPAEVEAYCRRTGLDWEWTPRGLRTRKLAPAVARHPKTGDVVFFNQLQAHHISCVDPQVRESLLSLFGEEYLPRNVYYGDGSQLEDAVVEEIIALYRETAVVFPWQQGDVLAVDNMLSAHGRNPYSGARKIVVAMGDIVQSDDVAWKML